MIIKNAFKRKKNKSHKERLGNIRKKKDVQSAHGKITLPYRSSMGGKVEKEINAGRDRKEKLVKRGVKPGRYKMGNNRSKIWDGLRNSAERPGTSKKITNTKRGQRKVHAQQILSHAGSAQKKFIVQDAERNRLMKKYTKTENSRKK